MIPIIQSTTFKYDSTEDMADLFDLKASGYFYTRLQNPTNDMVAAKIAALEGGVVHVELVAAAPDEFRAQGVENVWKYGINIC